MVCERRNWLYPFPDGAGRPNARRSGTVARRSNPSTGFSTDSGSRDSATPMTWLGTPRVSRRTTFGGVRTDSITDAATSATSTAISAAELPAPTTRTARSRYADGSR
jgi:hypothetical protein